MSKEDIYEPPKSNLSSESKLGFEGLISRERNLIACIILVSVVSYALGVFQAERSGKSLAIMSPFLLGGLFPVTALLSALIIRFVGNTEKVYIDYLVSLRVCWSLGWRVVLSTILSMIVILGVSLSVGFRADQSPIYFFVIYWVFVLPLSTWVLYSRDKKGNINVLFRAFRGF